MPHEPTTPFLKCLELGLTLKDSCEAADIPYNVAKLWVSRGRRNPKGVNRPRYRQIIEAQTTFLKALQFGLLKASSKGDSKAAMRLAERFEHAAEAVPDGKADPIAEAVIKGDFIVQCEAFIRIASARRIAAEKDGSHVAAEHYLEQMRDLGAKLYEARTRPEILVRDLPDAEYRNWLRGLIAELSPAHRKEVVFPLCLKDFPGAELHLPEDTEIDPGLLAGTLVVIQGGKT